MRLIASEHFNSYWFHDGFPISNPSSTCWIRSLLKINVHFGHSMQLELASNLIAGKHRIDAFTKPIKTPKAFSHSRLMKTWWNSGCLGYLNRLSNGTLWLCDFKRFSLFDRKIIALLILVRDLVETLRINLEFSYRKFCGNDRLATVWSPTMTRHIALNFNITAQWCKHDHFIEQ